jgi:transcription initiation factor IIE alpha subunit
MSVKITYDFVKKSFEKEGYKLLSREYVNNITPLHYICPNGHEYKIKWSHWRRGQRCPHCTKNNRQNIMYNFVKKSFEQEGYKLLSKTYKNNYSHLYYICPNGHEHKITWDSWNRGNKCPYCVKKYKKKLIYEQIKKSFKNEGYELLSKEYKKNNSYLYYKCPNGHTHKTTWYVWRKGHRCPSCIGNAKITYDFVKKSFEKEGYTLLSKEYINAHKHLKFKCPNGHKHTIKWNNWRRGQRCSYCAGNVKFTYEQIKKIFEQEGYKLLSKEYKNVGTYLHYICPRGHKHKITLGAWRNGQRCGQCDIRWSKNEKEIVKYIKKIYKGTILENNRSLIKNPKTGCYLELDIWLPELNKAIEYDGTYWHSDVETKFRDRYKAQWCKDNNIDLLVIKDTQWIKNKDWNMISNFIRG